MKNAEKQQQDKRPIGELVQVNMSKAGHKTLRVSQYRPCNTNSCLNTALNTACLTEVSSRSSAECSFQKMNFKTK